MATLVVSLNHVLTGKKTLIIAPQSQGELAQALPAQDKDKVAANLYGEQS